MANRTPKSGPIVDARLAIATIDESSSEAELRLAEERIAEGLRYAEQQIKARLTRARYLRDAITGLSSMQRTFERTWRPVEAKALVCEAPIDLDAYRERRRRDA